MPFATLKICIRIICFSKLMSCLCRGMLSAAHVLAMDAKNLLDVVDSIRIKNKHVDDFIRSGHEVKE